MLVRRLLLPLVLAIALLGRAVPASAGPRTDAAFVRATNADRHKAVPRPPPNLLYPKANLFGSGPTSRTTSSGSRSTSSSESAGRSLLIVGRRSTPSRCIL